MVRLRLRRTGTRNKPCYRIVAADKRSPRDGRFIEILGYYDPRHQDEQLDLERAEHWLNNGAQPSETVASIIARARSGKKLAGAPAKSEEKPAAKAEEKAPEEAAAATATETAAPAEEASQSEAAATTEEQAPDEEKAE